jgi:hypothetical protein
VGPAVAAALERAGLAPFGPLGVPPEEKGRVVGMPATDVFATRPAPWDLPAAAGGEGGGSGLAGSAHGPAESGGAAASGPSVASAGRPRSLAPPLPARSQSQPAVSAVPSNAAPAPSQPFSATNPFVDANPFASGSLPVRGLAQRDGRCVYVWAFFSVHSFPKSFILVG